MLISWGEEEGAFTDSFLCYLGISMGEGKGEEIRKGLRFEYMYRLENIHF